ncbi:polysaccharide biosynthesis/export family protein [Martelella alba]|nr:polysaccharide biosynthesis/export family protein [Martelella alba]
MNAQSCAPDQKLGPAGSHILPPEIDILSPGDLIDVSISDDDVISGKYEISQDGMLRLMHVPPVIAKGRSVDAVEAAVRKVLIDGGLYNIVPLVSIRVMDFAPARVFVAGAVFEPGSVTVGAIASTSIDRLRQETIGGRTSERRLARALQSAGGVRPDADLSRVAVVRGGHKNVYDMRPVITGHAYPDPLLLEGDQIEIPSRDCFQEELMVPSAVSPPGVKVFMSNLSVPASSNAQAAISKDTVELRYGTRFLQAVFSLNCVGGARLTNSNRSAVLFTRNPITGQSIVIERNLEQLLRRGDRDDFDPYLMPGDALACYDSSVINITDLATKIGIIGALGVIM